MTNVSVLIKRGHLDTGTYRENGMWAWRQGSGWCISQDCWKTTRSQEAWNSLPHRLRRNQPCGHLNLRLPASNWATVDFCHLSPSKPCRIFSLFTSWLKSHFLRGCLLDHRDGTVFPMKAHVYFLQCSGQICNYCTCLLAYLPGALPFPGASLAWGQGSGLVPAAFPAASRVWSITHSMNMGGRCHPAASKVNEAVSRERQRAMYVNCHAHFGFSGDEFCRESERI